MATATTNVQLNVTGNAQQQLLKTQQAVTKLQESFGKLRSVVGGLAIGAMITNMFRAADAITDLSDATGIAVSDLLALRQAFALSGGDADTAEKAILKLYQSIDEAAGGNDELIKSFEKIGISLQDIGTLSEQEILEKTLRGLAAMGASAEAVALKMKFLSKEGRNVDISAALKQYEKLKQVTKEAGPGIVAAGKIFDNLQKFKGEFGTALAEQFSGLLTTLANLSNNTKSLAESLAQLTKIVAVATATWAIFAKIIPAIETAMGALFLVLTKNTSIFNLMKTGVSNILGGFLRLFTATGKVTEAAGEAITIFTRLKQIFFTFSGIVAAVLRLFLRFAGVVGIIYTVAQAIDFMADKVLGLGSPLKWLGEKFSYVFEKAKEFFGELIAGDKNYFKDTNKGAEETAEALEEAARKAQEARERLKEIREENQRFLETVHDVTKSYRERNAEVLQGLTNDIKYLNMTDEQIALDKNRIELNKEFMDTLKELGKKRKEAMADPSKGAAVVKQIDAEIKKVQESAVNVQTQSARKIKAYYAESEAIRARNLALDLGESVRQKQQQIKGYADEIKMLFMSDKEREKYKKGLDEERAYQDEIAQINLEQQKLGKKATDIDIMNFKRRRLAATMYLNERLLQIQELDAAEENSGRKLDLFFKNRIDALKEELKPENQIVNFMQKFEEQIDNLVTNGKFKFKDMMLSWLQEMLAAQAKMAAMDLFGPIFKSILGKVSGGITGMLLKIFGFAEGGNPPVGKASIVGEKGPELFVPKTAGTIIPNHMLGKGTNNVNAPVTNNYITNNISAIDAKSVAQLFAENRKTLLGSVKMAEREMPYMAR